MIFVRHAHLRGARSVHHGIINVKLQIPLPEHLLGLTPAPEWQYQYGVSGDALISAGMIITLFATYCESFIRLHHYAVWEESCRRRSVSMNNTKRRPRLYNRSVIAELKCRSTQRRWKQRGIRPAVGMSALHQTDNDSNGGNSFRFVSPQENFAQMARKIKQYQRRRIDRDKLRTQ